MGSAILAAMRFYAFRPKTRRFARQQHARVDDASVVRILVAVFGGLPMNEPLVGCSASAFRIAAVKFAIALVPFVLVINGTLFSLSPVVFSSLKKQYSVTFNVIQFECYSSFVEW